MRILRNGIYHSGTGHGVGVVDALYAATKEAIAKHGDSLDGLQLFDWNIGMGQGDQQANAWCVLKVRIGNKIGFARAGNPDTNIAAAKAYIYAINNLLYYPVYTTDTKEEGV